MADHSLDDLIAAHYARQQEGLPPPLEPHPGYATWLDAFLAHRRWLREHFPLETLVDRARARWGLPARPGSPPTP